MLKAKAKKRSKQTQLNEDMFRVFYLRKRARFYDGRYRDQLLVRARRAELHAESTLAQLVEQQGKS